MSVFLSPVGGVAGQFFDNNGNVLTGGKIYTYAAGTTTPQATYTSVSGNTAHSNPVILDSAGRVPSGEIWLTNPLLYKFVLKSSTDVLIGTYDNIGPALTDASFVTYTPSGSSAVTTTVQTKLRQIISAMDYVTSGSGTSGDPYLGWNTGTPWAANIEVVFPKGVFGYSTTLSLPYSGIYLHGVGIGTVLKFTGTGNCVEFNSTTGVSSPRIENFYILGNANATNGIYTNNAHYGVCRNVSVVDVPGAGFRSLYGVYWLIENFYISGNGGPISINSANGIYLGESGNVVGTVTAYTIINANIVQCTSAGINIDNGWGNTIIGGSVEANARGVYLALGVHDTVINGLYLEGNTNAITVDGDGNNLIGLFCYDGVSAPAVFNGNNNHVFGGTYSTIVINANSHWNDFTGVRVGGPFTDNGGGNAVNNVFVFGIPEYAHPTFISSWVNNVSFPFETLTSSGSNITSAINTTGFGIVNSNAFYLAAGATYLFQWYVTLNSGTLPQFVIDAIKAAAATGNSAAGNNTYIFTPLANQLYYFTLRTETGVATDFACSGINVKQIN